MKAPLEPPLPPPVQETVPTAEPFQTGQVVTVAGGHFVHDTYSAFIAPLLPLLQERLATNYALTGGLAVFPQLPSLLNPLIGYLADKVSLRYFIILAPAVTATLMSAIGLASSYFSLALLLLAAGVSVAAFHAPAPAMVGRMAGSRVGTGMSVFMAAGRTRAHAGAGGGGGGGGLVRLGRFVASRVRWLGGIVRALFAFARRGGEAQGGRGFIALVESARGFSRALVAHPGEGFYGRGAHHLLAALHEQHA